MEEKVRSRNNDYMVNLHRILVMMFKHHTMPMFLSNCDTEMYITIEIWLKVN